MVVVVFCGEFSGAFPVFLLGDVGYLGPWRKVSKMQKVSTKKIQRKQTKTIEPLNNRINLLQQNQKNHEKPIEPSNDHRHLFKNQKTT